MKFNTPPYRSLLFSILFVAATTTLANSSDNPSTIVLADFADKDVAKGWKTVNDNVMGGRSKGGPTFSDGILSFEGATNTNGGGFSSIRSVSGDYDLTGKTGLLIRARGDGRTYKASLQTNVMIGRWEVPFRADFTTVKGEWREFYLPLEAFTPTMFGRRLNNPPALDMSKVSSFGFMIYDKNDGPFKLEVDWVKAVMRNEPTSTNAQAGTIIDQAVRDGRFGTLAAALTKAELVGLLQSKGPFTVFAPTDEAFAKLPKGTLENLLKPENREKLEAVLKYHLSAGKTRLVAALDAGTAKTAQGESLSIAFSEGRVQVDRASILNADIICSNGVIHVIDTVLLPPSPKNDIPSVADRAGVFTTLLAAVKAAGLDDALASKGPFTVFAPTDDAFKALAKGTVENLLKEENRNQLKAILAYHVIPGKISAGDALNAKEAKTLNGMSIDFGIEGGKFKVNNATILKTDIVCDNGVIHVIDQVLLPPKTTSPVHQEKAACNEKIRPIDRIESAITRGVPIFNQGYSGQCAEIYRECLVALTHDDAIDSALRTAIKNVLKDAAGKSDVERAWIYRRGLDLTYQSIDG